MDINDIRLPRKLEEQERCTDIRRILSSTCRKLRPEGRRLVPFIPFSHSLQQSLYLARRSGQLIRGLESAQEQLGREQTGLDKMNAGQPAQQNERISRLVLFTNDGSQHFYQDVEHLLDRHAPRLLGCRIDTDGYSLGSSLYGEGRIARLVLADHKASVIRIFLALTASG
ncbi:MAG: hypothetical protein GY868_03105 [Deltaproteobacteria bacterium]|nr:hypothetical protein [Deltaproteobacteria bacterium]